MFAGEIEGEWMFLPKTAGGFGQDERTVPAFAEGQLQGVRQAAALVWARHDAVDDDFQCEDIASLEHAFRLFDANGDNLISYQEIKNVLETAKDAADGVNEEMIQKALKDIGKQAKNVQLTFAEFK
jgi:hypothetical protein